MASSERQFGWSDCSLMVLLFFFCFSLLCALSLSLSPGCCLFHSFILSFFLLSFLCSSSTPSSPLHHRTLVPSSHSRETHIHTLTDTLLSELLPRPYTTLIMFFEERKSPVVLISGGGLGGLLLGILLERAGIQYHIFERATTIKPLGKSNRQDGTLKAVHTWSN